ncbi:MAG: hypothetical protein JW741_15880, partial [Sedimentisphaerales bacterium]|nr:hypothetical protein [Sedimentisphaerales bacterium]
MWKWLTMGMIAVVVLAPAAQAARDITGPADVIVGVPDDGVSTDNSTNGWPGNEVPKQAIDNQITTKYLHFKGEVEPTGLRITPAVGPTIVTGVTFTSANDAVERDPIRYELSGSNVSINGPYTLIAAGDIVDFVGETAWPRRTKTTTPMQFENTVEYRHYQIMFPTVRTPGSANSMQIAEIELLMDVLKATAPNPADGAVVTMPLFQWTKGDTAAFHDVYFGTSPDLTEADRKATHMPASVSMYFHVGVMEPGVTYYWRVDQIDSAGNVHTGDVWSVLSAPKKAYAPSPRDGDKWLAVDAQLNWTAGAGATQHAVYFGTDEAAVAARDAGVAKGSVIAPTFDPGVLQENTTYFWAVDETAAGTLYVGDVWQFTTISPDTAGGAKGDYFMTTTPEGQPALTRIDPEININLTGATSPGAPIPGDGWSARWTADLEIAVADTYTFSVNCQDGTRLWIDGQLIVDQWVIPTVTSQYYALPMFLDHGIHSIRLEYFDSAGDAVEQLYWSSPSMAEQIVPGGPLQPPVRAQVVYPATGAVDVASDAVLMWNAGMYAVEHDVYFGDDKDAVLGATPDTAGIYQGRQALAETKFDPGTLEWGKTYFWRVDEVNDASPDSPWTANVWGFTTADFLVVEDFEKYTDNKDADEAIYQTWIDGWVNDTGSQVGYDQAPFAETGILHGGRQSMPLNFANEEAPFYSEASREFASPQDWTVNGGATLVLYVRGLPTNTVTTDTLYVAVEDTAGKVAVVSNPDTSLLLSSLW